MRIPSPPAAADHRPTGSTPRLVTTLTGMVAVAIVLAIFAGDRHATAAELPTDTNHIESLSPAEAAALVETCPGRSLNLLPPNHPQWAFTPGLPLDRLQTLELDTARVLARCNRFPLVTFDGLKTLDARVASRLASGNAGLSLRGLTRLDLPVATALARFDRQTLSLGDLSVLDAEAARALGEFKGTYCHAGIAAAAGVPEIFAALGDRIGCLTETVCAQTPLTLAIARAIGDRPRQVGGSLPALTTFAGPDAVVIAAALARRQGLLALPNLKRVSPRTLSALLAKEDVDATGIIVRKGRPMALRQATAERGGS